jgi:8-oxo-dGTP pyrophosphatase MutT (NUDIX family)
LIAEEILCETPHLVVSRELLSSPLKPQGRPWLVVRRKPAVIVIPRLPDGTFLLIRQERPPVRRLMLEFPAGQIDGEMTETDLEETARRELLEETGYEAEGSLIRLGRFFSSPGFTNENQTVFLANVNPQRAGESPDACPEPDEAIAGIEFLSLEELRAAIAEGRVCDANTLAGFAYLHAQITNR